MITAKRLKSLGACADQVAKFRAIFGDEAAPMTVETAVQHAHVFNWNWAAKWLLKKSARAEYERVEAPACAEYERVTAAAFAEYKRVTAPALAEYERVKAPALAEYKRVTAPAWAEYERVKAPAFASAYIKQETEE